MSLPLVSIMMPAHNAARYIEAAIESIQAQTYKNWQLCIVDDGSKDETHELALAKSFQDSRILVDKIHHQGCPAARNACLAMMTGDIYARQDADDLSEPTRIEDAVQFLLDNKSYDLVSCGLKWLQGDKLLTRRTGPMIAGLYMTGKGGSPVCASIVCWEYVYRKVGGFDETMLAGSDGDWNFRTLAAKMHYGYIPKASYIQRRHPGQLSQAMRNNQRQNHEKSRKKHNGSR